MKKIPKIFSILQDICIIKGHKWRWIDTNTQHLAQIITPKKTLMIGANHLSSYGWNSILGVQIAKDKTHTLQVLRHINIRVPRGRLFFLSQKHAHYRQDLQQEIHDIQPWIQAHLSFPCIIKPNKSSQGQGVRLVHNEAELTRAVVELRYLGVQSVRAEEYIQAAEWRLVVHNGRAIYAYKKAAKAEGQPANMAQGASVSDLIQEFGIPVHDYCKRVSSAMNLTTFGLDIFTGDIEVPEEYTVLEVNARPGTKGLRQLGGEVAISQYWTEILGL